MGRIFACVSIFLYFMTRMDCINISPMFSPNMIPRSFPIRWKNSLGRTGMNSGSFTKKKFT